MYRSFTYKNKNSLDFGLFIAEDFKITSPSVRNEFVEVIGADGELLSGDLKLKNTKISIPVYLSQKEKIADISNWLKSDVGWHDLTLSSGQGFIYQAVLTDEYDFEDTFGWLSKGVLSFDIKPFKFLKTGLEEITLGSLIKNPLNRPSKPRIKIEGTGNISLRIGKSILTLKNVDRGIIVDSLYQTVTNLSGSSLQWDKLTSYPLPEIEPGINAVTRTGNITSLKVIPRWEAIV